MELPEEISSEIEELSADGSDLFDSSQFQEAIQKWSSAMVLLPDPRTDWDAYTWLAASIGDAHYQLGQIEAARHSFYEALNGPDGIGNPFVYYRLGQCQIKLGDEERGSQSLLKAYMLDGEEIFHGEPDGLSYLQVLRDKRLID